MNTSHNYRQIIFFAQSSVPSCDIVILRNRRDSYNIRFKEPYMLFKITIYNSYIYGWNVSPQIRGDIGEPEMRKNRFQSLFDVH